MTGRRGLVVDFGLAVGRSWVRIPAESGGIFPTRTDSYPEGVCYGPNGEVVATQPRLIHFTDATVGVLPGV